MKMSCPKLHLTSRREIPINWNLCLIFVFLPIISIGYDNTLHPKSIAEICECGSIATTKSHIKNHKLESLYLEVKNERERIFCLHPQQGSTVDQSYTRKSVCYLWSVFGS